MMRRRLLEKAGGPLPSGYTQLTYIRSTGTQYIDTNYIPNANTVWVLETLNVSFQDGGHRQGRHGAGQRLAIYTDYNSSGGKTEMAMGSYEQRTPDLDLNKRYTVTFDIPNHTGTISDYGTWTFTPITWDNSQTLYLFRRNVAGTPDGNGGWTNYSHVITENGVEKQHFIPAKRDADQVVGMYDLCGTICPLTGTPFYTNAGSGTFIGG